MNLVVSNGFGFGFALVLEITEIHSSKNRFSNFYITDGNGMSIVIAMIEGCHHNIQLHVNHKYFLMIYVWFCCG